jgi:Tfp pilus assembly protein FimT
MAYTTIDDPTIYFNTVLYTGNGGSQNITGVGFSPDWVWLKGRNNANNNNLNDTVRGVNKQLYSDLTNAETTATTHLTAFDSDGFTLGNDGAVNGSSDTYVSWNWKAGGSASSNSNGSITSSVSANTTAGFSIVSYTGTGSAGQFITKDLQVIIML